MGIKKHAKKTRKRNKTRSWTEETKNWIAMGTMGTLLFCTPVNGKAAHPATTMCSRYDWELVYFNPQATQTQRFDIPPGPLETVLTTFQNHTGLQVLLPDNKLRTIPFLDSEHGARR